MVREFIAYKGEEFTIEWYFDPRGRSQSLEYYEALNELQQNKLLQLFKLIGNMGKICNEEKFRNEGDQIFAFKAKPNRFLCFFVKGSKIIVTNAFEKKSDKLPPGEKIKALKFKIDYLNRVKEGTYYGQEKNKKKYAAHNI